MSLQTDLNTANSKIDTLKKQLETKAKQLEERTKQLADQEVAQADLMYKTHKWWIFVALAIGVIGFIVGKLA